MRQWLERGELTQRRRGRGGSEGKDRTRGGLVVADVLCVGLGLNPDPLKEKGPAPAVGRPEAFCCEGLLR